MNKNIFREDKSMERSEMIAQINEKLETATDTEVENVFWMLELELGNWEEVIQHLIHLGGGWEPIEKNLNLALT